MNQELCVIVGVGPGLGMALAERFGRENFTLALIARKTDALQDYVTQLKLQGIDAQSYPADAGDIQALGEAFAELKARQGVPSVLIYNAAVLKASAGSQLDPQILLDEFKVNVVGALTSVRQVVADMRERHNGTILFTGGGLALNPSAQYASLSIGKAALRTLALSLATELEPAGIHVATVTISGIVRPNSRFSPERIAELFWQLHTQLDGEREREIVYKGI